MMPGTQAQRASLHLIEKHRIAASPLSVSGAVIEILLSSSVISHGRVAKGQPRKSSNRSRKFATSIEETLPKNHAETSDLLSTFKLTVDSQFHESCLGK